MSLDLSRKGAGIVSARFGEAHSALNCTNVLVLDPNTNGVDSACIIGARGRKDDHKLIGIGGLYSEVFVGSDYEGTDI